MNPANGEREMATPKQVAYITSLMITKGYAHATYHTMNSGAKNVPHGPTMAQRSGSVEAWASNLTVRQASDVIASLK